MSTRCLTVIQDKDGKENCVMYRHCDGYPDGHGKELKDFLRGMEVVNGIQCDYERVANGIGCLSAQIVSHFKKSDVGGIYLHPPDTRNLGEDYIYFVTCEVGMKIKIKVVEV